MRTFSDDKGRSITAELMNATDTTITIRRDDGRVFDFPRASLSPSDKAYVADWLEKRAYAFGGVEVSARRVRLDSDRKQTRSSVRKSEKWCFKFIVENKSRATLHRLSAEYRVFHVDDKVSLEKAELPLKVVRGMVTIGTLAPGSKRDLQTKPLELDITQLKPGYHYSGTNKRRVEDSLEGIWIRILQDGETIAEFANPSRLPEKQPW